jgi:hypothetical protein
MLGEGRLTTSTATQDGSVLADVRIVFDLGTQQSARAVSRSVDARGRGDRVHLSSQRGVPWSFEVPPGTTVEEALRRAKARRFNSNLVIDLEPGRGQAFAPKGLLALNP